jgi:histidinol-phosphatase
MNPEWKMRHEAALEAAQRAGQLALRYFTESVTVEWKHDQSPVTIADREAEQLLRNYLLSRFPNDGFLGEEFGEQGGTSGFRWIIDPIDGTRSFVRGIPIWATLVGLEFQGEQISGVVDMSTMKTTYHALRGDGAFRNGQRIRVSDIATLDKSLLFYSSISWFLKAKKERQFMELARQTERQRGFGDFYGFVLVAQGSGEVMAEHGVKCWDVAALKVIVEEAGGRFSDWDGTPTIHRPDVIASNGRVHEAARLILAMPGGESR